MKHLENPKLKLEKFIILEMLISCAYLVGCDSGISDQIEKCVQAAIASNGPYKDSQDKAGTEAIARGFCLRAASGKD